MRVANLSVERGDLDEYELAVDVTATLNGDRGVVVVERRYEALPRQNDTVDRDALDTDDELLADAATVHVHTKFWAAGGDAGDGTDGDETGGEDRGNDGTAGGHDTVDRGDYLGDDHTRWEPTDPSVLTDGASFETACRTHFEETASATYERGADAR